MSTKALRLFYACLQNMLLIVKGLFTKKTYSATINLQFPHSYFGCTQIRDLWTPLP
jgi:hypothetical protein